MLKSNPPQHGGVKWARGREKSVLPGGTTRQRVPNGRGGWGEFVRSEPRRLLNTHFGGWWKGLRSAWRETARRAMPAMDKHSALANHPQTSSPRSSKAACRRTTGERPQLTSSTTPVRSKTRGGGKQQGGRQQTLLHEFKAPQAAGTSTARHTSSARGASGVGDGGVGRA